MDFATPTPHYVQQPAKGVAMDPIVIETTTPQFGQRLDALFGTADKHVPFDDVRLEDVRLDDVPFEDVPFEVGSDEMPTDLTRDPRAGLVAGEIRPDYMPIVDVSTGEWVGVEALSRWHHPTAGVLRPEAYLGQLERAGWIVDHDRHIIRTALVDFQHRIPTTSGDTSWRLHFNLTAESFQDPSLGSWLADAAANYGIEPRRLGIELTETSELELTETVRATIWSIRAMGASVVIDDFGTGYNGLSLLRDNLFDALKFDAAFLHGVADGLQPADEPHRRRLVIGMLTLAQELGLPVIFEGVETSEQERFIREHGCRFAQGYHYSKPLSLVQIARELARRFNV